MGFVETYNGAITALATCVVAIFTGVLFWATNKQARLTRMSIDLARAEYISTHRPKLTIRHIVPEFEFGKPIKIHCTVTNVGETPARIEGHRVTLRIIPPSFDQPVEAIESSILLLASDLVGGQSEVFLTERPTTFIYSEALRVDRFPGAVAYLEGEFIYLDDNNIARRMGFSRQYNPNTKRFDTIEFGEEEYQD